MFLNRVELIGFLGNDAETRYTPAGTPVTTLSLATKTTWMQDGDRRERTEWHKVQAWSKLAEYAAAFKKGAYLRIVGELRSREYDGKNGKVQTYEIGAETVQSLRNGQRVPAPEMPADEAPAPQPAAQEPPAEPAPAKTRKRSRKTSKEVAA
jgi:single-strand DNA-binding protein